MIFLNLFEVSIETAILVILITVIGKVFKKQLNPNIRYFLWIFVALRILVPIQLELSIAEPAFLKDESFFAKEIKQEQEEYAGGDIGRNEVALSYNDVQNLEEQELRQAQNENQTVVLMNDIEAVQEGEQSRKVVNILIIVWVCGMVLMVTYVMINNIKLNRYLKAHRQKIQKLSDGVVIYNIPNYNCLFGIIRPAIYVCQEQFQDQESANHIICHEIQHYQVGDHWWQLVRTICLTVQWFNPFVWWAYFASKRDGELACDYRVTKDMTREERYKYGYSLLGVLENRCKYKENMTLITSVRSSKRFMTGRIKAVMQNQYKKHVLLTGSIVIVIALFIMVTVQVYAEQDSLMKEVSDKTEQEIVESNPITVNICDYYITNRGTPDNLFYIDENHVLWGSGSNEYGQLGQGTQDYIFHPEMMKIAENVVHVDYSQTGFVIYLTADGKLYGLGNNERGALQGYDEFNTSDYHTTNLVTNVVTTPVLLMENVKYARCGREDVAVMKNDNSVWIWGMIGVGDGYNWLGTPQSVCFEPQPIQVLENAVIITGGFYNHAALLEDGSVWTWGSNLAGNCGVEGKDVVERPTKVAENARWVWTGMEEYNVDCQNITQFAENYKMEMNNTVIQKKDGTYLICGINVGTEEKVLPFYYEAVDFPLVCTAEWTPYDEACATNPSLIDFMQR